MSAGDSEGGTAWAFHDCVVCAPFVWPFPGRLQDSGRVCVKLLMYTSHNQSCSSHSSTTQKATRDISFAPLRLDIAIGMAHMLLQLQKVSCFDNYEPHTRQGDATGPGRRSDNVALSNVNGICRKRINHFPRAPWVCAPNGMRSASLGTHPVNCLKRVASVGTRLGLGWSSARTVRKAVRELSIMKATLLIIKRMKDQMI